MRFRRAVVLTSLLLLAPFLYGHDLFIKLDAYFLPPDADVRIPILNGTFTVSENSITPDRVVDVILARPTGTESLGTKGWDASGDTTFLTLRTGEPGTYMLGIATRPNLIELAAADFNEYLEHDGIPDVLEARRVQGELDRGVVEKYSKHVKAVFQVGESTSRSWDKAFGLPAEIVPRSNPYELAAGGTLEVLCLVFGEPVANQLVIAGGEGYAGIIVERSARTDEEGIARFAIEGPGRWYVKFIHMEKTAEEGVDYESNWATLSFQLR